MKLASTTLFLIFIVVLFGLSCEEQTFAPIVYNIGVSATIYVKDNNTNNPIAGATIQWESEEGRITEQTSATTDQYGRMFLTKHIQSENPYYDRVITHLFAPGYYGQSGRTTIRLSQAGSSYTFYMIPQ